MGAGLSKAAEAVGVSERTLRRYASEGLLRGRRLGPDQLELAASEERYLRTHWDLLAGLKRGLRTERDVRLAVLFGSQATGEDRPDSDVDLLVVHRRSGMRVLLGLQRRLRRALGRPVHLVALEHAEMSASLLADVLEDGRVVVDRDGAWEALKGRQAKVLAAAYDEDEALAARAYRTVLAAGQRA
ncbi:MAG: type VII toxin-antitoxin system MntA family adenylyltransferase antitoxin [Thermoleophilaceae bacterium]|jgi:predicted nucleotidyltransferase